MPCASHPRTSCTVIRIPRMHGFPPRLPGSTVMRPWSDSMSTLWHRFRRVHYVGGFSMKLAVLAACLAPVCLQAADPHMTPQERTQLVQYLKDSQKEFLAAVLNLSDEQWKWKPAPERWSVGECAEHILLAEGLLFAK